MSRKKLGFIDSTLRDGQEALLGGRLRADLVAPVLESLDTVGFESIEAWGGGTFRSSLVLLHEDPWEELRILKKELRRTPLQMHIRGRFLVGDRPFSFGFVKRFLDHAAELGVNVVRLVDPLNNIESLAKIANIARKAGLTVQLSILCSNSTINLRYYEHLISRTDLSSADALGVFDPWGTLSPATAIKVIELLRKGNQQRVFAHLHSLTGASFRSLASVVEKGVSIIDTCFSAFSYNGSLPAIESVLGEFDSDELSRGLDLHAIVQASNEFTRLRNDYFDRVPAVMQPTSLIEKRVRGIAPTFSSLLMQRISKEGSKEDGELREEIKRIMKELSLVALLAPVSGIIVRQALLNLHSRTRYGELTDEFVRLLRGALGEVKIQKYLVERLRIDLDPEIADGMGEIEERVFTPPNQRNSSEDDLLSFILYPHEFIEVREANLIARQDGRQKVVAAALALLAEIDSVTSPTQRVNSAVRLVASFTRWRDSLRVNDSDSMRKRGFVQEPF